MRTKVRGLERRELARGLVLIIGARPPVDHSPTRLKSFRGPRNAHPAALIITSLQQPLFRVSRNLLTVLRDIPNRLNKIQETICYESVIYLVINANTLLSPSPFAATKAAVGKLLSWAKPNDANMSFWSFLQREKFKKNNINLCNTTIVSISLQKPPFTSPAVVTLDKRCRGLQE